LRTVLQTAKQAGFRLPIIFKSSGYELVSELEKFSGLVDIYLPDFKFGAESEWAARARAKDYFSVVKSAIAEMIRQTGPMRFNEKGLLLQGTLIRHVLAPLPDSERNEILEAAQGFSLAGLSVLDNFQLIE
jgi:putative pyruvate formate lyase activating enzyme